MSGLKEVFIFGYSGHAYVVLESLLDAGYKVAGYFDFKKAEKNPYNLSYLGFEKEEDLKSIIEDGLVFPTIGENSIRAKLLGVFEENNLNQFAAIDPRAAVSQTAIVFGSTYIGKNAIVNAQAQIGKGVIINTNAIVEHECKIGELTHIAPGSVLCGNVSIGKNSFLGANAVVKQNIQIGSSVLVGAGSVVVKNLPDNGTWVGNPVRFK